jgi:LSD1 subclass zinc finger protein
MAEFSSPQALTCPSCSAPFDYDGRSAAVRCPYCNTMMAIPDHLREDPGAASKASIKEVEELMDLVQQGQKIEAIRLFRERFGVSLKQSKLSIDAMEQGMPVALPEHGSSQTVFTAVSAGEGTSTPPARRPGMLFSCTSVLLVLVL